MKEKKWQSMIKPLKTMVFDGALVPSLIKKIFVLCCIYYTIEYRHYIDVMATRDCADKEELLQEDKISTTNGLD